MDEDSIKKLEETALSEIEAADGSQKLEELRIRYLGRKSRISGALKELGNFSSQERAVVGKAINEAKKKIEEKIAVRKNEIGGREREVRIGAESLDITLPSKGVIRGKPHPLTQVLEEVIGIFAELRSTWAEADMTARSGSRQGVKAA